MSDTASVRSSIRSSTFLNRPQLSPVGPRTRQSSLRYISPDAGPLTPPSATSISPNPLRSPQSFSKPLPSPLQTSSQPLPDPSVSSSPALSIAPTLPNVIVPILELEEAEVQEHIPQVVEPALEAPSTSETEPLAESSSSSSRKPLPDPESHARIEGSESAPAYSHDTQTESTLAPLAASASSPARISPIHQAHPKLIPPPAIKFDTTPVPWKSMPLEAALWTFDSTALQNIVSRAIRASAKESFVRLLTLDNLDKILPAELERLDGLKATTQARYRFLVHRRTMLFHALNSVPVGHQKGDEEGGVTVVSTLTAQLADTITDCDQRLEELLKINDQTAQINKLIEIHSAGALAVALRKLNSSYSRRTKDLNEARRKIAQLEAELEDAWKEAEKMAKDLDDYENAIEEDNTVAIIETAEVVSVPQSPSQTPPPILPQHVRRSSIPMPMTPTLLQVRTVPSPTAAATLASPTDATSSADQQKHFVFPPVTAEQQPPSRNEVVNDNSDAVSIKSNKSSKSTKSNKSGKGPVSRTTSIYAAKKRSHRASQSSLRLSVSSFTKVVGGPSSGRRTPYVDDDVPPPMPELPAQFTNAAIGAGVRALQGSMSQVFGYNGPPSANASSTLLHFDGSTAHGHGRQGSGSRHGHARTGSALAGSASLLQQLSGPTLRRQSSLDTVCTVGKTGSAAVDAYRGKSADDIYLRTGFGSRGAPPSAYTPTSPYSTVNAPVNLNWDDDSDIQVVPRRTPLRVQTFSGRDRRDVAHATEDGELLPPTPPPKDPSKTIPSMWMNVDALKPSHPRTASSPVTSSALSYTDASSSVANSAFHAPEVIPPLPPLPSLQPTDALGIALHRRSTTYDKIKGLTKRYSASLPLFNGKTQKATVRRSG